jgi:hypothetical protein
MRVEVGVVLAVSAQGHERPGRQRHEAIFAALRFAYMYAFGPGIDVTGLKCQRLPPT